MAFKMVRAGSSESHLTDAIGEAVRMLSCEPGNNRRIVLLISETRDLGSKGRKSDVLFAAEINHVEVYAVDMPRLVDVVAGKTSKLPRPDTLLTTQKQGRMPAFIPAAPNSVENTFGLNGRRADFVPMFKEVSRDARDVVVDNPVELMTKGTGGNEYAFLGQRGLEGALAEIGRELHSQYIITYLPNNRNQAGFHKIDVAVTGVPHNAKVRARPGYWVAAKYTGAGRPQ